MADIIEEIFHNRKAVLPKLVPFGFVRQKSSFVYEKALCEGEFKLTVTITAQGQIKAEVTDVSWHEPYRLHLVEEATGSFVGAVRAQYEEILREIAAKCFAEDVFRSVQAKEVIAYVETTYGDQLEFLWKKFPDNAVWRRKDTGKWYAALLTVSKRKLGIPSDEMAEIIDLRMKPDELSVLIDHSRYFPGYHMNKTHWITIILDDSVGREELFRRLDESYLLAVK